jgi:hypothetical protein
MAIGKSTFVCRGEGRFVVKAPLLGESINLGITSSGLGSGVEQNGFVVAVALLKTKKPSDWRVDFVEQGEDVRYVRSGRVPVRVFFQITK